MKDELNLVQVHAAEFEVFRWSRSFGLRAPGAGKERNMSPIQRSATFRTLSFAISVALGIVGTAYAQSAVESKRLAHPSGSRLALDQWPVVAGHRRPPTAAGLDRLTPEHLTAPVAPHSSDKDGEVQLLYDEIMRQTDAMIRP